MPLNLESESVCGRKKTMVGIITYNPDMSTLIELITSLACQNCDVLVFDNASSCQKEIVKALEFSGKVTVLESETNIGLAAAANEIFRIARQGPYEFVVLFDQDSVPSRDYVDILTALYFENQQAGGNKIAAISGAQRCRFSGKEAPFIRYSTVLPEKVFPRTGGEYDNVDFLITSGCLFPLSAIDDVGVFDESLFIDNVDVEWCFRARELGYNLLGCSNAWFSHSIGDEVYRAFGKIFARKHSPIRSYYSIRNLLALCRRSYVNKVWKANAVVRAILKSAFILLVSNERKEYARQIFRALRDYRRIPSKPIYDKLVG
ncbi:glycosyltransferase family 2 protein [Microbulbifer hainanensis]|uniref:glycosyltransferase family 2 protein n=1 Tax=Microbulbifer hainanensis TaxID=2735675 RepID=UPI0018692AE2|nr:glycosyltransferase family 2 protein [Microbulbifer hainanensis]